MTTVGTQLKNRVDVVFDLVAKQRGDEETFAHWARYLCVLSSGLVEVYLKAILMQFASVRSHPDVTNFIESRLEGITNLNEEKVYQLLNAFRPDWAETFRKKRTDAQKAALDSVVANRNNIAHGRSVGLTLARIKDYYREIIDVLEMIERDCVK